MKTLPKPWMLDLIDLGFALNDAGKKFEIRSANNELCVDVCLAGFIHLSTPLATISIGVQNAFPKEQMRLLLAGLGIAPIVLSPTQAMRYQWMIRTPHLLREMEYSGSQEGGQEAWTASSNGRTSNVMSAPEHAIDRLREWSAIHGSKD